MAKPSTVRLQVQVEHVRALRVHDAGGYVAYINLTSYAGDQR
jgi:hypothetical protein